MKILYFDCFSGISGDMTLGALLDLGIDRQVFVNELQKLNLPGYEIRVQKKVQQGIAGTDVEVIISDHSHREEPRVTLQHEHSHLHHPAHSHHEQPRLSVHHGRNLTDIEQLIDGSDLNHRVKAFSKQVFQEIARAEGKVHHRPIEEVHFHEVGAVDSIVDIVGAAICLDLLGVKRIISSPLHEGQGFIECQHGLIPVPVPAVMEMLAESHIPVISENVNTELVTPTGLGIIKCLAAEFGPLPAMMVDKVGYGFGKRETGRLNALRVVMGTLAEAEIPVEEIISLETNVDDMSPELLGYMMERLLANGALDVYYTPIYMKKNRPAVMITVMAEKGSEERLARIILEESSTLGIRITNNRRYYLPREIVSIETEWGPIKVKVASQDSIRKVAPEYEDCKRIAEQTGLALQEIYRIVLERACRQLAGE